MKQRSKMNRKINNDDLMNFQKVHERDQYIDIKIQAIGDQGDAIGKLQNGMSVIIKNKSLKVGQVVDIEITVVKDKFAFAKVIH